MRVTATIALILSLSFLAHAKTTDLSSIPLVSMPSINLKALLAEDEADKVNGVAPRFAYTHNVNLSPANSGAWTTEGSLSIWRLRIESKKAESINLGFTQYELPTSASLYIYSMDRTSVRGPFNSLDNNQAKQLWTPVVFGEQIVVELRVATAQKNAVSLLLTAVNHDYIGFGKPKVSTQKSGSCNVDVVCGEGAAYQEQIRSVATISFGGSRFCSGSMINNTANDGKPFFLTANHCGVRSSNAATLVAYWNFENSTCRGPNTGSSGGRGDGRLDQFTTGATFRASLSESDFTLVEFNRAPDAAYRVYYAGWDSRKLAPTSSVAIHHPNVDEKRISFDSDPGTISTYLDRGVLGEDTHIKITDWDIGTTEPGSSGSPLFNQDKRIIGQLHGGYAACGNDDADWYGFLAKSWDNGSPVNSLKPWLDAAGTGETFIDGFEVR
ncbi:MAG: trypsin-like peptidase domain-containing protein [Bdellovibrionales bacterium]|nr:trypsin-like peptidase domain-containing protein [Bdellovibrionales bacterium]